MEGESAVTRSIIDELHCSDIQGDQMERESGATRSTLLNFILWISNKIKWKVKVVLLEVSLMNFNIRIWSNGRRKLCYSKFH